MPTRRERIVRNEDALSLLYGDGCRDLTAEGYPKAMERLRRTDPNLDGKMGKTLERIHVCFDGFYSGPELFDSGLVGIGCISQGVIVVFTGLEDRPSKPNRIVRLEKLGVGILFTTAVQW